MANKCGGCNLFAGKVDPRCSGPCRKFFHRDCVVRLYGSEACKDSGRFVCGVCTVIGSVSAGGNTGSAGVSTSSISCDLA